MKYPNKLVGGNTIAIISPSNGLNKEREITLLENAEKKLEKCGFNVIEDKYVRCSEKGVSTSAIERANEFLNVVSNKSIDAMITVTGGDFLLEILEYIEDDVICNNLKWVQGQSDSTILLHYLTTKFDIATIYSCNATLFGENYDKQIYDNIAILKGEKIKQTSFDYYISEDEKEVFSNWHLLNKKNLNINGRIIGGCLECLLDLVGTKYDYTKQFLEKYKSDNIIWYFDIDYMNNEDILRGMWHLKNAGWFDYTNCILFGRVSEESFNSISLEEAISRGIKDYDIDIITNVDLGHTNPRITIINGGLVNIEYNDDSAVIKFINE